MDYRSPGSPSKSMKVLKFNGLSTTKGEDFLNRCRLGKRKLVVVIGGW